MRISPDALIMLSFAADYKSRYPVLKDGSLALASFSSLQSTSKVDSSIDK